MNISLVLVIEEEKMGVDNIDSILDLFDVNGVGRIFLDSNVFFSFLNIVSSFFKGEFLKSS